MNVRTYASPEAFKKALEERLRKATTSGPALNRRRQLLVFDRFLARVTAVFGDAVMLKGGLVLEIRLERARATKDVDLRMTGSSEELLTRLQEAGRTDLGDFMAFEVGPDPDHPEIQGDGVRYDGMRFRATCSLADKIYGESFGVDVAFGDPIHGESELVGTEDVLAFAGIAPPRVRLYPVETHIAEKLHAYTMPRSVVNSRVKDLPDIALLATVRALEARSLRAAIMQTFAFRATHPVPERFPDPPAEWTARYAAMAVREQLAWPSIEAVTGAARAFLEPVLAGEREATWNPATSTWEGRS